MLITFRMLKIQIIKWKDLLSNLLNEPLISHHYKKSGVQYTMLDIVLFLMGQYYSLGLNTFGGVYDYIKLRLDVILQHFRD